MVIVVVMVVVIVVVVMALAAAGLLAARLVAAARAEAARSEAAQRETIRLAAEQAEAAGAAARAAAAGQFHAAAADEAVARAIAALRAEREVELGRTVEAVLNLAGDKLGAHLQAGAQHLDSRNEVIARQLDGMTGELRRVNDVVVALQRERAEQHGQLLSGLQETVRQSQTVAATTQSLREALSSSRARGQWGERMADDVLRLAGFVEGINYRRQSALAGGTIPDFTFLLPGGWLLHMDVKFPMDNYLRHLQASTEAERRAAATQFLRDVRERVRSLGNRGYIEAGVTLDYVLLFIPNEATYGFVHEQDPQLADLALAQKVVLCSPFTLFAVLGVIRQAVDSFALARSTDEILHVLAAFSAQWDKFSEAIDLLGRRIDSTAKAYEELSGVRRRQLQKMVDRVDDLRRRDPDDGADVVPEPLPLPRAVARQATPLAPEAGAGVRELARRLTG